MRGVRVYFLFIGKKYVSHFIKYSFSTTKESEIWDNKETENTGQLHSKIPVGMECFVYNITCYNNQIDRKT
ncbi:Os11g0113032 [Oryza sativa Japonica Group]|jgi:hypothetical protein|uniref:Os11g0113032 protein n=1 Tax=Oryza sativa subsp. japonica TaxID=39947 RepID=A0A0P0XYI8_ORYSJ|nr:Os11g0113032 [Oryza sativa Japonica Group]